MKLTLKGRIENVEFDQQSQQYFMTITTPAEDAYSKPNSYRGRTAQQLGAVGSEVTIDAVMSGAVHLEKWKDRATGQPRQMYKGSVYFHFFPAQARPVVQPTAVKG